MATPPRRPLASLVVALSGNRPDPHRLICAHYVFSRYPQQSFGGVQMARRLRKLRERSRLSAMILRTGGDPFAFAWTYEDAELHPLDLAFNGHFALNGMRFPDLLSRSS
jgi:hypothetical protein